EERTMKPTIEPTTIADQQIPLELTPRMRYLLRLALDTAELKRHYDDACVERPGDKPDPIGHALTTVLNRLCECIEHGDDRDDDDGDDDSQDTPAGDGINFDIDLSGVEPKPATT